MTTQRGGRRVIGLMAAAFLVALVSQDADAQQYEDLPRVYHPLDQSTPPGMAGRWATIVRPSAAAAFQYVSVGLESGGRIDVYDAVRQGFVPFVDGQPLGLNVGHLYRLRLSDLPGRPGVELYPTIELVDRLHPPAGRETEFPVPVDLDVEDLQHALNGHLVTRVVYLEQPQLASTLEAQDQQRAVMIPNSRNALAEADRLGRPMAIVRIGGRVPPRGALNSRFFGTGGAVVDPPVMPPTSKEATPTQASLSRSVSDTSVDPGQGLRPRER